MVRLPSFGSTSAPVRVMTQRQDLVIVTLSLNPYVTFRQSCCALPITSLSSATKPFLAQRPAFGTQIALNMAGSNKDPRRTVAMFRLDYLSCFLTILATILVGRKMWTGLIVSGVNSLIVCVIGLHTSQYGFIPANVFCICINAFNLRAWLKAQKDPSESANDTISELVAGPKPMSTSDPFTIRREGRLRKSISSLAVKGVWPFAPTLLRTNTNAGVPHV
jgi:hypothetical protein